QAVMATGAIERPLVFADNDRPGIMLAGAVRHYVACHGVAPGRNAVVVTNNDSAHDTVHWLTQAGVNVVAVLDVRQAPPRVDGAAVVAAAGIVRVHGAKRVG